MAAANTIRDALTAAAPRPAIDSKQAEKKNYAERLSRALATKIANLLRPRFRGITPDEHGARQEAPARTAKGVKKLDVNYSTTELGLGLGISIKTINFPDPKAGRYTKNYTRVDNELRAEAKDYHQRQPYAVLVALIFLPLSSCLDGSPSSFGAAVRIFRHRTNRRDARDEQELLERIFIGVYDDSPKALGRVWFFDVMKRPRKEGPPAEALQLGFDDIIGEIERTYAERNDPPFEWDE